MTDNKLVSGLPEKFEVFEENMLAAEKKPVRRNTPAKKPDDMPAPKKVRPKPEDVPGVGGMIEKRWSGLPMWACPKCGGTTFKPTEAKIHRCKQVKYAAEEGLAD